MEWPHSGDCLARLSGACAEVRLSKARSEAPGTLREWPGYGSGQPRTLAANASRDSGGLMTGDSYVGVNESEKPTQTSSAEKSHKPASRHYLEVTLRIKQMQGVAICKTEHFHPPKTEHFLEGRHQPKLLQQTEFTREG